MKRTITLLLCLFAMIGTMASCSSSDKVVEPKSTEITGSAEAANTANGDETIETERAKIKDSLPDNLKFNGEEIRFVGRDDGEKLFLEIFSEEDTGDVVEAAVYKRNMGIEDRLNILIKPVPMADIIHGGAMITEAVRKSVLAGSDDYDVIANHMSQTTPLIFENMLIDLNSLDYLDFTQPWWSNSFIEQAAYNDKCYFMAGDISLTMIQSMYLMYYNKNLYSNYFGKDDMYDIVANGEWNLDNLASKAKTIYTDVNGDSTKDSGDIYGYSTTTIRLIDALLGGCDVQLTDRDPEGKPYFVIEQNENSYKFVEKVHRLLYNDNCTWLVEASANGEVDMLENFSAGKAVFIPYTPMGADSLRGMEDNFGVVPMPKLDENQKNYTTTVHNGFSAFAIVQTTKFSDVDAAFCEAVCAENYRTVIPSYYEVALKIKYSRDDETSQMLDMIRDSIKFDFAYIYNAMLNNSMTQFRDLVQNKSEAVASYLAKSMEICNVKMEDTLTAFGELK